MYNICIKKNKTFCLIISLSLYETRRVAGGGVYHVNT